jgi:hypothetical protein
MEREGGLVIKRKKSQKKSFVRFFSQFLISTLLLVPLNVHAEPLVLVRTAEVMDMINIIAEKNVKLSATLKMDKNGDMVVQCFNLFSVPVARTPFGDNPGIRKMAQRTRMQVEPKGKGVFVKLTFLF